MCTKDVLVLSWIINYVSAEQKNPHESVHINRVDIVLKTVHYALFLQLYAEQYTVFVSMLHSLLPTICRTVSCTICQYAVLIRLANSQQLYFFISLC